MCAQTRRQFIPLSERVLGEPHLHPRRASSSSFGELATLYHAGKEEKEKRSRRNSNKRRRGGGGRREKRIKNRIVPFKINLRLLLMLALDHKDINYKDLNLKV